ncbi:hypothetical protein PISMIDRAFT_20055, partial [Pisolithus microcarpus 441]
MATLQPSSFEEDTGTFTGQSSPDSPATGSPITFAPPSPPSETPTSTLLYPNSTSDGIDGTFGLPEFHPVPIITVAPPSSPLPSNLLHALTEELEATELNGLEDDPTVAALRRQIRREEHQSLTALLTGLTRQYPNFFHVYFDSDYALAGQRGIDQDDHYYQDFLLLHTYFVQRIPGSPWNDHDEYSGSAYVRFYPNPRSDPADRSPPPNDPILSPDPPDNPDPPSPHSQLNTRTLEGQDPSLSPPVEPTYLEVPPTDLSEPSLLFQVDNPPPEPDLSHSCPLHCTSHCIASEMFDDLPGESISFSEMMLHLTSTNHVSLPDGLGEEELL